MQLKTEPPNPDRRGFFRKALALALTAMAGLAPVGAGLMVLIDPLRRKAAAVAAIKVTTLDSLPKDGIPRRFPVVSRRTDAWNSYPNVPIGAVYLRRTTEGMVEALNVVCPHAGCFVDYSEEQGGFLCPCHNSSFAVDGKIADPLSPSPRGLDPLKVQLRGKGEVWVVFQNFQAGRPDRVPAA